MNLSPRLRDEYAALWASLVPDTDEETDGADRLISACAGLVQSHADRYLMVSQRSGVPWPLIGALHYRESGCNFSTHLANGDSLRARTHNEPRGLIHDREPPYEWNDAAVAALEHDGLHVWRDWTMQGVLFQAEIYNGSGYRKYHSATLSPYLWSFSNHETGPGKYSDDDTYDPELWDEQVGVAVIIFTLIKRGAVALKENGGL